MKHSISEITLSTGTKGILIDVPNSDVMSIKFYFRAGYQFGDFNKYEAPHLIEHHILNATKKYPKKNQIMAEFSKNGAGNNAMTNPHFISYVAECAEFEYERIFDLMAEVITRPIFPIEHYETERENVRTELTRYLSDYARQASLLNAEANFPELSMNYSKRLEQIDSITHDDVVNHYHKTHTALNSNFVITGAVSDNREGIIAQLETIYSSLPKGSRNELLDPHGLGQAKPVIAYEKIDSDYFSLAWFADGGDDAERAVGRILGTILTGGFASRIYGKVRDEGLTYHISSGSDVSKLTSSFGFSSFANVDKLPRLFELIAQEASNLAVDGPRADELQAAKDLVIGSITLRTQTIGSIAGWYAGDYVYDGSIQSYDDYFDLLKSVDQESIKDLAQKFFFSKLHSSCHVGPVSPELAQTLDDSLASIWR
jgi:predicted Zn-dependent peptidase